MLLFSGEASHVGDHGVSQKSEEYNIRRKIFVGYDPTIRPVHNASRTLNVSIGLYVEHLQTVCKISLDMTRHAFNNNNNNSRINIAQ